MAGGLIGFEQDPELPEGTGTFRFADGSSAYGMDPELASSLGQRLETTASPMLASNAPMVEKAPAGLQALASGALAAEKAQAQDAPAWMANPASLANMGAPQSSGGAPMMAAPPAALQGMAERAQAAEQQPAMPAQPQVPQGGPPPPRPMVYTAGRNPQAEAANAVAVPTQQTTVIERDGREYDPYMAALRVKASEDVDAARMAEVETQRARAEARMWEAQRAVPQLEYQAKQAQWKLDKIYDNYKVERAKLQTEIDEFDKNAKVDPSRFFKERGTFATIGLAIAQGLGAYAASINKTDNFAQRIVENAVNADIASQQEEIKAGRISRGNKLAALMEAYGGDIEQAKTALKLLQDQAADRQIQAYASAAESEDAALAANTWLAQRREQRLLDEQKFMDQSVGKVRQTITADMVQPRQGGSRPMTDEELLEYQTKRNKKQAEFYQSENDLNFEKGGGKNAQKEGDPKLYVEGFGYAKSDGEAVALRKAIAEHQAREQMLDDMATLNEDTSAVFGVGDFATDANVKAKGYRKRFARSLARSFGGANPSDREAEDAESLAPDPTSIFSGSQKMKMEQARKVSAQALDAQIQQIVSGNHPSLPKLREPGAEEEDE